MTIGTSLAAIEIVGEVIVPGDSGAGRQIVAKRGGMSEPAGLDPVIGALDMMKWTRIRIGTVGEVERRGLVIEKLGVSEIERNIPCANPGSVGNETVEMMAEAPRVVMTWDRGVAHMQ
jgi:hypothetical protein